jgi:hypothetical protein
MAARLIFGVLLLIIGFCWGGLWTAAAGTSTETGIWNEATWSLMAIAALGLIPLAGGIYLLVRAVLSAVGR